MKEEIEDQKNLVFGALESAKFNWRTISGISKETGLDSCIVEDIIMKYKDEVIRSSRLSKNSQVLYTTRTHFRDVASPSKKIIGALKNRID